MFFEISGIIITVLEAIGCFLFFDVFRPAKNDQNSRKRRLIAVFALSVSFVLLSYLIDFSFLLRELSGISVITILMSFILRYGRLQALVLSLLFQGYLIAMEYLGLLAMQLTFDDTDNMTEIEEIGAMNISLFVLLLMLLGIILLRRIFRVYHNEVQFRKEWIKFLAFPVFTNLVLIMTTSAFRQSITEYQAYALYGIGIGLVVMNFYVFYLLDNTILTHRKIKSEAIFQVQKKDQMEMYTALYNSLERQKSEAHDFRNHIICLKSLADKNDMDNVKSYLDEISQSDIASESLIDTHHPIINAIINTKYYEAASQEIVMICKINDLSNVRIHNDDLVVIISNLLNNAIEATAECDKKKYIYFKMELDDEDLVLSIKNPFVHANSKIGDEYISSKDNSLGNHGIGLKNVKKVIEKYNGSYVIKDMNRIFSVTIVISNQ